MLLLFIFSSYLHTTLHVLTYRLVEKDVQTKQLITKNHDLMTTVDWLQTLIQDNEDFYLFGESSKRYGAESK